MFSTFATLALLASGATTTPSWKTDYTQALQIATTEQKPVVVFIGKGETGYAKLVGGSIPSDAGQLLAQNYVCVYVNTDTAAGQKLAGQFEINKGLIISGKGGSVQALRYTGAVSPLELTGYLSKYKAASAVATTETAGEVVAAPVATGSSCANGNCGGSVSSFPSSGCASGNCAGTSSSRGFRRR
jgi:hypothetical protein